MEGPSPARACPSHTTPDVRHHADAGHTHHESGEHHVNIYVPATKCEIPDGRSAQGG